MRTRAAPRDSRQKPALHVGAWRRAAGGGGQRQRDQLVEFDGVVLVGHRSMNARESCSRSASMPVANAGLDGAERQPKRSASSEWVKPRK